MGGRTLGGQVAWRADLTLELLDPAGNPISRATREVAWTRPGFQLQGLTAPISAFTPRPGSNLINPVADIRSNPVLVGLDGGASPTSFNGAAGRYLRSGPDNC